MNYYMNYQIEHYVLPLYMCVCILYVFMYLYMQYIYMYHILTRQEILSGRGLRQ